MLSDDNISIIDNIQRTWLENERKREKGGRNETSDCIDLVVAMGGSIDLSS